MSELNDTYTPPEQEPGAKVSGYTRIPNDLLDALCRSRIAGEERQVFDVILRKTLGFGKKEDAIPLTQIEIATGLGRNAVCRGIKGLRDKNLITSSHKKGTRGSTIYRINEVFTKWVLVPKKSSLKKESHKIDNKLVTFSGHSKETSQKKEDKDTTTPELALDEKQTLFVRYWKRIVETLDEHHYIITKRDNQALPQICKPDVRLPSLCFDAAAFLLSDRPYHRERRTLDGLLHCWNDTTFRDPVTTTILRNKGIFPPDGTKLSDWLNTPIVPPAPPPKTAQQIKAEKDKERRRITMELLKQESETIQ